jgi:hypothetical protein
MENCKNCPDNVAAGSNYVCNVCNVGYYLVSI